MCASNKVINEKSPNYLRCKSNSTIPRSLAKIYAQVKGSKSYYDISIENGKGPNCCNKWEIKSGGEIDWKACFTETKKI